jgi:hypothetical protein
MPIHIVRIASSLAIAAGLVAGACSALEARENGEGALCRCPGEGGHPELIFLAPHTTPPGRENNLIGIHPVARGKSVLQTRP